MEREIGYDDREHSMEGLLASECLFCGYSGQGYWQAETHDAQCPFFKVGGREERAELIVRAAIEGRPVILPAIENVLERAAEEMESVSL